MRSTVPSAVPLAGCCVWLFAGCATLPQDPVERALYTDLRKAVELSEDSGWVVERVQLEQNAEDAMRSVCQTPGARRTALEAWLSGRIALRGGSAEARYREGAELDEVSDALTLERTRSLLRYADQRASTDCPFWLQPDEDFRGVQGDAGRAILLLESQGFGALVFEGDEGAVGGGGGGRLLIGHGIGRQVTLAAGGEVGGTGAFQETDRGTRRIDTTFTAALPLLLRVTRFSRVFDLELAPTMQINPDRDLLPPGARIAVGAGLTTMRASSFMPYVVLWAGYEIHPARSGRPPSHSARIGTRVGIDWDP